MIEDGRAGTDLCVGSIGIMPTVTPVPLAWSGTHPGSRDTTSDGVVGSRRTLRQHRRGWAGGLYRCQKTVIHRMRPYVRTHMPAARLDRANWRHGSPRWKRHGRTSAIAAVWAQDRRGRDCPRFFPVYELLFTLRRTQGAIGRHEGATGAAVAAAGRLRRHGRCRRRIPGVGKGLTSR